MENVKVEPWSHKAKVAGFSAFAFAVAGTYNYLLQDFLRRSVQHQELALAGRVRFNTFHDETDPEHFSDLVQLAVWDAKDESELKRINNGWKTQTINDGTNDLNYGPQGVTSDDQFYLTQNTRPYGYTVVDPNNLPAVPAAVPDPDNNIAATARVTADAALFDDW